MSFRGSMPTRAASCPSATRWRASPKRWSWRRGRPAGSSTARCCARSRPPATARISASPLPLALALELAPPRRPAGPSPREGWNQIAVDRAGRTITRPVGVTLDSGGLAKGLAADLLAAALGAHECFAINAAGDVRVGGAERVPRPVRVASPFDGATLHTFALTEAGVATSGIGRRSWQGPDGAPAHHLLDPATGKPAFTGVVQATAIAPTALEAETRAKAAVLSGPDVAPAWLPDGGVLVFEDAGHRVLEPAPAATRSRPADESAIALLGLSHAEHGPDGEEAITSPTGAAKASPTLTGSSARKPRPASITAVSGFTPATVSSQPPSWSRE